MNRSKNLFIFYFDSNFAFYHLKFFNIIFYFLFYEKYFYNYNLLYTFN